MRRLFPILAGVSGLLLLGGLFNPNGLGGSGASFGLIATVWAHSVVLIALESAEYRVEALADLGGLPGWVRSLAEKNRRKALSPAVLGLLIAPMVFLTTKKGWVDEAWSRGLLGFNLAFQVGAYLVEFASLNSQSRLVRDVEGWETNFNPPLSENAL